MAVARFWRHGSHRELKEFVDSLAGFMLELLRLIDGHRIALEQQYPVNMIHSSGFS
jgi:hypothetical protein